MGRAKSKKIKDLERYIDRLKYELPTPKQPKINLIRNPKLTPISIKNGQYSILNRELILTIHRNKCDLCGYDNRDALEIHHINGYHSDNNISNIAVLCGNCHTLTTKRKIGFEQPCHIKEVSTDKLKPELD